jgi:hypothetical protein
MVLSGKPPIGGSLGRSTAQWKVLSVTVGPADAISRRPPALRRRAASQAKSMSTHQAVMRAQRDDGALVGVPGVSTPWFSVGSPTSGGRLRIMAAFLLHTDRVFEEVHDDEC